MLPPRARISAKLPARGQPETRWRRNLALISIQNAESAKSQLRSLPSVNALLSEPRLERLAQRFPRSYVANMARIAIEETRTAILRGEATPDANSARAISILVLDAITETSKMSPQRVINASGVILHTNLGRAPLSEAAARAAAMVSLGYSDLEFNLSTGTRGSRHQHVSDLLRAVTGAENGVAVNNNAAAALLVLSTLAGDGGEVIVSRSEAVEIGGGFRVPDVMRQSGATLVDVATTNRTYARDYEDAITPNTRAILRVHRSNFEISGFVHQDPLADIVAVAEKHGIPVVDDLGSGCLIETEMFGLKHEPTVQDSIAAGAHVTMFSGDKLLGGPQAGIIVGKQSLIDRVAKHPLARAVRIDKMTLAALNSTLIAYLQSNATAELPIWRMISTSVDNIEKVAIEWSKRVKSTVIDGSTAIGGGSAPGQCLPTKLLAVDSNVSAPGLARELLSNSPPIVGRIEDDQFLLDPRTVLPEERESITSALHRI